MKKRILSLLLAVCLCVALLPVVTLAAGEATHANHCVCGATHTAVGDHKDASVITGWTPVASADNLPFTSGHYYLTSDVTTNNSEIWSINSSHDITLCLNGHTLTANNASVGDTILINGTLTITDCKGTGKITGNNKNNNVNNKAIQVAEGGTLNLYAGSITGINAGDGSGGGVHNRGTFNMYGGSITNNKAKKGGGVLNWGASASNALFNLYGGTISGNTSTNSRFIDGNEIYNQKDQGGKAGMLNACGGTVQGTVKNWQEAVIETPAGYTGTTFNGTVTNGNGCIISGGIYYGAVNDSGNICGGTFYGELNLPESVVLDDEFYAVRFYRNYAGAMPEVYRTARVNKRKTVAAPAKPTAPEEGWAFGGWYKDAACTTAYDFSQLVTSDLDLYAKWDVQVDDLVQVDELAWLTPILGALNTASFEDVVIGDWFYDDVSYVNEYGLMTGTSSNQFSPNAPVTRGMVMTILARREGIKTDRYSPWYAAGCEWAKANGISDGSNPEAPITREQLAAMLYRYAQLKGYDLSGAALTAFGDASSISGYAAPAVQWAVGAGLLTGTQSNGMGKLLPQDTATRAQLAAMLYRFFG